MADSSNFLYMTDFPQYEPTSPRPNMTDHFNTSMQLQSQNHQPYYSNPLHQDMAQQDHQRFFGLPNRNQNHSQALSPVPVYQNPFNSRPMSPARPRSQGVSSYGSSLSGAPSPASQEDQGGAAMSWEDYQAFNSFGPGYYGNSFANNFYPPSQSSHPNRHVDLSQVQARPDPALMTLDHESPYPQNGSSMFSTYPHNPQHLQDFHDEAIGTSPEDAASPGTSQNQYDQEQDAEGDADDDMQYGSPPEEEAEMETEEEDDADTYQPRPKRNASSYKRRSTRTKPSTQPQNKDFRVSKTTKATKNPKASSKALSKPATRSSKSDPVLKCPQCPKKKFKDAATLERHALLHTSPPAFTCTFAFADCPSSFHTKNEWKRHVETIHCNGYVWICTHGTCTRSVVSIPGQSQVQGREFNRGDLLKPHLKRMHFKDCSDATWNDDAKAMVDAAKVNKVTMPKKLQCPRPGCEELFEGNNAFKDRMEHVGKHLEKGEDVVQENDLFLVQWALNQNIIEHASGGGFRLSKKGKKARSAGSASASGSPTMGYQDDDVEGVGDVGEDEDAYGEFE